MAMGYVMKPIVVAMGCREDSRGRREREENKRGEGKERKAVNWPWIRCFLSLSSLSLFHCSRPSPPLSVPFSLCWLNPIVMVVMLAAGWRREGQRGEK